MPTATAAWTVAMHSSTVVSPPSVSVETGGSGPKACCCMSRSILAVGVDRPPAMGDLIQLRLEIARQRAVLGGGQAVGQLLGPAGADDRCGDRGMGQHPAHRQGGH